MARYDGRLLSQHDVGLFEPRYLRSVLRVQNKEWDPNVRSGTHTSACIIEGFLSMNAAVDKIVNSVLYEGYMLYPYRRSSLKNQHRWNFGIVYPQGLEPSDMKTECLVEGADDAVLRVEVRFLQLFEKDS